MNPRNTGFLLVVALLLAGFVWFYEYRGAPAREAEQLAESLLFPGLDPAEVREITLESLDGGPVTARRSSTGWRITAPVDFPAVSAAFDAMAKSLATLKWKQRIDEPAALEVYGLDEAARVVRFNADGSHGTISIGQPTPVGSNVYLSSHSSRSSPEGERDGDGDDGPIDIVRAAGVRAFDRTLDQLRDGRVIPIDRDTVDHLELRWREGSHQGGVTLDRIEGSWKFSAPVQLEADAAAVVQLLESLRTLQAYAFQDGALPDRTTGLATPVYEVEVHSGLGELTMTVGSPVATDRAVAAAGRAPTLLYVQAAPESLYLVPVARIAGLPHSTFALRQKQVSRFMPADAHTVELVFQPRGEPAQPVRLELREPDAWYAGDTRLDRAKVRELIDALADLEASGIAADSLGKDERSALGLAPARIQLRVLGEASPEEAPPLLAEVGLGETRANGNLLASRHDRSEIYEISPSLLNVLPPSRAALLERLAR